MASFGQGIRPELGAIDYSAYSKGAMQGAQSMQRGMEQLGAGLAQGIEKYAEISKQNKEKDATIKSTVKFLESFQDMPNMSPEFKKVTLDALGALHDPKASRDDLFAISQNAGKQLNMVMGMGKQAFEQTIAKQNADANTEMAAISRAKLNAASGPQVNPATIPGTEEWKRIGDAQIADEAAKLAATAAGRAAVTQDQAILKQTKEEERTVQKEAQDKFKFLQAAESRKNDLLRTLAFVRKAKGMASGGAGGRLEGSAFGQFVSEQSQDFASTIDSINSNLRLGKMADLKSLSTTGATGFGQQSDKEGEVMESYLGKLSAKQPEKTNIAHLNVIENSINQLLSSYDPEAAWNGEVKVPTWNPATKSFN